MSKGPFLSIVIILLIGALLFGYYTSTKKGNGVLQPGENIPNNTGNTVSGSQNDTPVVSLNSLEQLVENFLLVQDETQINKLIEQDYLSSYLLTTQKILQEGKILTKEKRKQIEEHTDIFLSSLYKALLANEKMSEQVEPFKTDKEFIKYFHESVFTGKIIGQDMDISETVANNQSYCSDEKIFPTEKDKNACKAQMTFFHAKVLDDCNAIDGAVFPGWRELCDDYFKMIP